MKHLVKLVPAFALAVVAACPKPVVTVDPPAVVNTCEQDEQCAAGSLCIGGECVIANCQPAVEEQCDGSETAPAGCCKEFENCDTLTLTCTIDRELLGCPATEPDCVACLETSDCFDALGFNSFCSGARCFTTEGRLECTSDLQCSNGDRCDRNNFYCVPDAGGCRFCSDFPELCCSGDQICDDDANTCVTIEDGGSCTPENASINCRADQQCDENGRCVFCLTDDDCGIGTVCNNVIGKCVGAASACFVDADCVDLVPDGSDVTLHCINNTCTAPQCETTADCHDDFFEDDEREVCENFRCVLPPAVCDEDDEPNNSQATAVTLDSVGSAYGGTLCRGDTDFISFPVQPQKRYTVTVTVAETPVENITVTLFNTTGGQESNGTFTFSPRTLPVLGVTSPTETGRFTVAVSSAGNTERDSWGYSVTIAEANAGVEPDCSAAAQATQEPNDVAASAIDLALDTPTDFTRCGVADTDFFRVVVGPQQGVEVKVDNYLNAEGNLNPVLLRGPAPGVVVTAPSGSADSETMTSPEGPTEYLIKVSLPSPLGALPSQPYRITARAVDRPEVCDPDVGENDDTLATAQTLTTTTDGDGLVSGSVTPLRCNPQDLDHFKFTVPARLGGAVRVTSTQNQGDLKLELFNAADGTLVSTSNLAATEVIDLPQLLEPREYIARVSLATTTTANATAQPYTLSLSTFSAGSCLDSEPTSNNTYTTALCVGAFDPGANACNGAPLPLPLVASLDGCVADDLDAGCGRACGNGDLDLYRLGLFAAGRTITARLEFDPAEGDLSVELGKVNVGSTTVTAQTVQRDGDHDGFIELNFATIGTPKDHVITVRPQGTGGHEAQLYALSIDVSEPCVADAFDAGANNATPATSTQLRSDPTPGEDDEVVNATVCVGDTADVYEILAFDEEIVTARIDGPTGVRLKVGTRPASLTSPAVPTTTIDGDPAEAVIGASGLAEITVRSSRLQQLYFTVDRSNGADAGSYVLTLDYTPGGEGEGEGDAGEGEGDAGAGAGEGEGEGDAGAGEGEGEGE